VIDAPGDKQRARLNRRRLLKQGLGAAAAAKLLSVSGFADAVSAAPAPAASAPSLSSQSGTVNLRFMRFAGPQWVFDTNFVNQFMEENPNIKVEGEDVIYDEMFNKCLSLGATDQLADVFSGHNIWAPYLAYKGLSYQLDDAANAGKFTDFDDFFPSVIADARGIGTDGKLFWIPTVVHPAGNAVIIFNMNILNEKGVTPPASKDWTIADYEAIIRASASPDQGIRGTNVVVWHPLYTQQYTRTWGSDPVKGSDDAWLLSRDGKTLQMESPPVKTALEWYHGLAAEGLATTSGERAAMEGSGLDPFSAGMLATTAGTVGQVANYAATVGDRFEMQAVLWPKGPGGHRGSCLSYNTQSVWSKTQHPDEAIALVNYITGPEPALWSGLEGTLHCMARHSAWFSPDLWAKYPVMQDAAEWFDGGIDPFPQPYNLRFVEWQDAWNQETTEYFDGGEEWDAMIGHTLGTLQGIIDQPRP
jgi:ABC-type glycerol-3-phosphate transport system substrate-binding protein